MARISKSDTAPKDAEHFSLGAVEFDLTDKNTTFETDDPAVIANARANPALSVKEDPQPVATLADAADPLDPHVNPAADHLSASASPEAIAAADTNEQAIKAASGGDVSAPTTAPTIEETLSATLTAAGVQDAPALPPVPEADAQPTASTPSTPPPTSSTPPTPSNGAGGSTSTTSGADS
jgi:hypothetical protein